METYSIVSENPRDCVSIMRQTLLNLKKGTTLRYIAYPQEKMTHFVTFHFAFYSTNNSVTGMFYYIKSFMSVVMWKITLLCYLTIRDPKRGVDCELETILIENIHLISTM